jgi:ring-1,2-phenylacetyl-CoA epoxidase subunit PaaC
MSEAIRDLLYKMADDELILGHRNSEWTGLGPMLEEDIAFSSMAQDKVGQSLAFFELLHSLGESEPDTVAFTRNANQFHNCQFVELPIGEYDFSLVRHFLFDNADYLRFSHLKDSAYTPLSDLAKKFMGEVKYHLMHGEIWMKKLANGNEESLTRLQKSLDYAFPFALGIFEKSEFEDQLITDGIYNGEEFLKNLWLEKIQNQISKTPLQLDTSVEAVFGGRKGMHTEYLQPLLDEMSEVFKVDPGADW